jgi:hypothetical protein
MSGIRLKFSGFSHIIYRNFMYYNVLAYIAVVILVMNEVEDVSKQLHFATHTNTVTIAFHLLLQLHLPW